MLGLYHRGIDPSPSKPPVPVTAPTLPLYLLHTHTHVHPPALPLLLLDIRSFILLLGLVLQHSRPSAHQGLVRAAHEPVAEFLLLVHEPVAEFSTANLFIRFQVPHSACRTSQNACVPASTCSRPGSVMGQSRRHDSGFVTTLPPLSEKLCPARNTKYWLRRGSIIPKRSILREQSYALKCGWPDAVKSFDLLVRPAEVSSCVQRRLFSSSQSSTCACLARCAACLISLKSTPFLSLVRGRPFHCLPRKEKRERDDPKFYT